MNSYIPQVTFTPGTYIPFEEELFQHPAPGTEASGQHLILKNLNLQGPFVLSHEFSFGQQWHNIEGLIPEFFSLLQKSEYTVYE